MKLLPQILLLALSASIGAEVLAATPEGTRESATPGGPPKLADFKIIQERNIFNPNRRNRSTTSERRQLTRTVRTDNLVLAGVLAYEKGTYAFFDGSSSAFRKVAKRGDKVGEFTVDKVNSQSVVLAAGTNSFTIPVGTQLRREEGGTWRMGGRVEFASSTSTSSQAPRPMPAPVQSRTDSGGDQGYPGFPPGFEMPMPPGGPFFEGGVPPGFQFPPNGEAPTAQTPPPSTETGTVSPPGNASGAPDDDVLRRLMQRREQEMNQ
jgi:hypothetical protein